MTFLSIINQMKIYLKAHTLRIALSSVWVNFQIFFLLSLGHSRKQGFRKAIEMGKGTTQFVIPVVSVADGQLRAGLASRPWPGAVSGDVP